jgi:membrane protein
MRSALSHIGEFASLFKEAGRNFARDNMPSMAAALAYNALLSLAPLLFVLVGVFRLLAGVEAVEHQIISQVGNSLGPKAVQAVSLLLDNMATSRSDALAVGGGTILLLIIFSTGVFQQLIHALNVVWKVSEEGRRGFLGGILRLIRTHFLAFLMLVCIGLYLYASVLMSAVKVVQGQHLIQAIPGLERLLPRLPHIIGPVALFLLFMLVFRILPARRIAWKDVWCGALVTTVLFWVINRVILYYLQRTAVSSFYGAAGSFVILLLWVYWSAMIVLYGAEFSKVCAERYGTLRRR